MEIYNKLKDLLGDIIDHVDQPNILKIIIISKKYLKKILKADYTICQIYIHMIVVIKI